jgi:RND family efflux transporter MFP subunit
MAAKAQRDLQRGERLYADQVISLEQLQDLRTQASMARAGLSSVQFNRGYSVITAPRDGVVLRKLFEQSELVPAGQTVLLFGARDRGYVVQLGLADREIVQLKLGDVADVRMDAFPGRSFAGKVSEISSAADQKTGMFPAEVRLDGAPVSLVSGLVARVTLMPASASAGTLTYVPVAAVVAGDADKASVFVVDGDHVNRRAVRIAFLQGTQIALAEGVKPGELLVTDGALYLADKEKIRVVTEPGSRS